MSFALWPTAARLPRGAPCGGEAAARDGRYNSLADIWSFGITILELAHGHAPFARFPPMKVLLMTIQNPPPTLDSASESAKKHFSKARGRRRGARRGCPVRGRRALPAHGGLCSPVPSGGRGGAGLDGHRPRGAGRAQAMRDIVAKCLMKDPGRRPTAAQLLEHKFFKARARRRARTRPPRRCGRPARRRPGPRRRTPAPATRLGRAGAPAGPPCWRRRARRGPQPGLLAREHSCTAAEAVLS